MYFSIWLILKIIFSGIIGIFPSYSHSQAAASDPKIPDITSEFVVNIAKVKYASKASPAPTASAT